MSDDSKDLEDRIIVVTGASRGIGYAAAKEAARRGAHVIAVARTVGGLEELDDEIKEIGAHATLVPADLTDGDGIDRMGGAIFARWGRIDGLVINAAALGVTSPLAHIAVNEFEKVMNLNVFSTFRLIRSFDLLLRQSDAGRVVAVSSNAAESARAFWALYSTTKAALNTMMKSYAQELGNTPIRANVFYPGPVRTALRAKSMPSEDPMTLPHPDEIAPDLIDMVSPKFDLNGMIVDCKADAPRPL